MSLSVVGAAAVGSYGGVVTALGSVDTGVWIPECGYRSVDTGRRAAAGNRRSCLTLRFGAADFSVDCRRFRQGKAYGPSVLVTGSAPVLDGRFGC